uniref:NADH-ubiquinone oxidoreductase chain 4L n=1 Tax=Amphiura digitula TaxID=2588555 RepID=A0A4Y5T195_9ECHI|nr:NADH dehydrogenase subunit 4L [Amphiura digitula]QDA81577.1 NADH dehydrogenase subunit 4L [Amphiura digitula]QHT54235.1 NADH dehydrogenase subunit 4L [Amphiura digitula]
MTLFIFTFIFSFTAGILSIIYKKKFFLSILISLEVILLNIVILNFILFLINGSFNFIAFSLFIIALAAVEASIGISIMTLISRNFSNNNIISLNLLKN